jgi:hypothetical protein
MGKPVLPKFKRSGTPFVRGINQLEKFKPHSIGGRQVGLAHAPEGLSQDVCRLLS